MLLYSNKNKSINTTFIQFYVVLLCACGNDHDNEKAFSTALRNYNDKLFLFCDFTSEIHLNLRVFLNLSKNHFRRLFSIPYFCIKTHLCDIADIKYNLKTENNQM